ncbi:Uncharacterized protein FWK35_00028858 [Aphis craccivora]|uniref:Uncharacterized protein n=1 Tax=Aphis craccivora TaxID=307492 RepID=A0A6G0Y9W1_APHCR|nr:Uncharacterized protein FWK35_00028858 [Aphis craccivora]
MAKSKLFNVVSEIEWTHLQSKNTNYQEPINFPASGNRSNRYPTPFFQIKTSNKQSIHNNKCIKLHVC